MLGSFLGLETAKRSLEAAQAAIETAAHNVANANTPGYSRQRVNLSATPALEVPGLTSAVKGQIGTGVQVAAITRQRDAFLDQEYWHQNQYLGQWTAEQGAVQRIEAILNEPSDTGLSSVLQNFWVAWDKLSADPTDLSARTLVVESAQTLAQTLNQTAAQLSSLQSDLETSLSATVTQVNSYLGQIAKLNGEIARVQALGNSPNDLMDQRDELVDKLSNLVDVSVTMDSTDGSYDISIGGQPVLQGTTVFTDPADPTKPLLQVVTDPATGEPGLSVSVNGGQLKGILDAIQMVKDYQADLDAFANGLANGQMTVTLAGDWVSSTGTVSRGTTVSVAGINGLEKMGYDASGSPGSDLFVTADGSTTITAANITVNSTVVNDVSKLAAGLSPKSGDGTLASTISSVRSAPVQFSTTPPPQMPLTRGTLDEFLQAMVGGLGVQGQQIDEQVTNQQALLQQVDAQRQSVAGVSIDEEMSDLIRFQQAYSASAKVISTLNDLFQNLLQNV